MILLSAYRLVCFDDLTCYLYHGCIGPARIPTDRDGRLDLINVWTYPRLIVECLHVTSLLSSKSVVLADSLSFENILAIYMLLRVLILVKSYYVSHLMLPCLLFTPFACFHDHRLLRSI
jgi:hypothetical protein